MPGHLTQAGQGHTACRAPAARSRQPGGHGHRASQGVPGLRHVGGPSRLGVPRGPPACLRHTACSGKARVHPWPWGDVPAPPCTRPSSSWPPAQPSLGDELTEVLGKNLRNACRIKAVFRGRTKGRGVEARMTRRSQEGQRPGGASVGQGVFQERGHPRAGAQPTTHSHVAEKTRLQVVPPRQAEALDIGNGASGLPVPRAVPQECPVVHGPGRGGW